ncbi:MAG: FxLYD domain-containing protein [Acidobacteriota bacterium]
MTFSFLERRWSIVLLILLQMVPGCRGGSEHPEDAALAEAYKEKIGLSNLGLAQGENYLGDNFYYVRGTLTNTGERVLQRVELTFLFKDSLGQVVLKETRAAVDYRGVRALEAGASTTFQVGFEHLPRDWNYRVPQVEVARLVLKRN